MNMQETKNISPYKKGLRDKIITTAMEAFAQKGIRHVKMDDVAKELGISKRTLYEIFDKKEDLLYEGVKFYLGDRRTQMEVKAQECKNVMEIILLAYKLKVEEFRQTNPCFYTDLVKYPKVARYLAQQNQQMLTNMTKFIERGIEEGFFRKEVNPELVARLFDALGKYVMEQQLYCLYTIEDIFTNLVFVTIRGICTEKGIEVIKQWI
jgi:AcrR family transcriptional regulator